MRKCEAGWGDGGRGKRRMGEESCLDVVTVCTVSVLS